MPCCTSITRGSERGFLVGATVFPMPLVTAFASKPAPTVVCDAHRFRERLTPCGSWLAGDGGLEDTHDFAPEPIPLWAGLLAKAPAHPALVATDTPPSRASPPPQGNGSGRTFRAGCQAVIAGKPAPTGIAFRQEECVIAAARSATRPPRLLWRAHGAGPERGHAEPRRGTERKGQGRLVTLRRAAFRFSK